MREEGAMATIDQARRPATPRHSRWLARAWTAVALVPVFFAVAFAVGEGLYALTDHEPGNADAPIGIVVAEDVAVLVGALVPCAAAVLFGRRARSAGDRRGAVPLLLGAAAGAATVILTVVSELGNLLR
jgi:hypothetical protein